MLPFDEPPIAINEKGLDIPSWSFKHFDIPFFAKLVFPTPAGPSKPKQ